MDSNSADGVADTVTEGNTSAAGGAADVTSGFVSVLVMDGCRLTI